MPHKYVFAVQIPDQSEELRDILFEEIHVLVGTFLSMAFFSCCNEGQQVVVIFRHHNVAFQPRIFSCLLASCPKTRKKLGWKSSELPCAAVTEDRYCRVTKVALANGITVQSLFSSTCALESVVVSGTQDSFLLFLIISN